MSIIFAWVVGIVFLFYPMLMVFYHKASTSFKVIVSIMCLLGVFFALIPNIIALIIAAIGVGLKNTFYSFLFAIFLIVLSFTLMAAELTALIGLLT